MSFSKKSSNVYNALFMEEMQDTNNITRKAKKKLREIAILEKKKIKTPDEIEKISQKDDWLSIVEPVNTSIEPTSEEVKARKLKQREKTKMKNIEKELREIKENFKKEKEMIKKEFNEKNRRLVQENNNLLEVNNKLLQENNKLLQENKNIIRKIEELKQTRQSRQTTSNTSYYQSEEVPIEEKIEDEFFELYNQLRSYKKVYKTMMLKYHPDKCNGKISSAASSVLGILKEKYKD